MNKFIVDTNVLIRLLVKDDPIKFEIIVKLVEKVENKEITLVIPTALISCKSNSKISVLTWDKKDFKKLDCEYYLPEQII